MENINELKMEQMDRVAGGKLTEEVKRYLRVLILKAKRDPDIYDATCFLNMEPGESLTDEQMNYVLEVWDYVN